MALPIEIPAGMGFSSKKFDMGYFQQLNPTGEVGFIQTLQRSSPAWFAQYNTPPLVGSAYNATRSFFDRLDGAMNSFLAYDPRRVMPYAYRHMSVYDSPWGEPILVGQSYANSTINLSGLTVGAKITTGDYISVQVNSIWYLFRVQENRTTPESTQVNDLLVRPRPNIAGLTTAAIRYKKACIEMKVIGEVEEDDAVDTFPSFSFSAGQFTRRAPI